MSGGHDRLGPADRPDDAAIAAPPTRSLPAISLALALPFYVAFVWAPTWPLALVFLTGRMFLNYFYLSSSVALVQEEVRPNQRVMSGALLLLVMNFIGLGLGPTYVGAASDWFAARGDPTTRCRSRSTRSRRST